jgi:hypothetical protein
MDTRKTAGRLTLLVILGAAGLTAGRSLLPAAAAPITAAPLTAQTIIATRATDKIKDIVTTLVVKDDETNR